MDAPTAISLVASIVSICLALFTIWLAKSTEKETRGNFDKTQEVMMTQHERTKDLLAEIDKRASVTEKTVVDTQKQILDTITNLVNEAFIPKKQDPKEVYTGLMLTQMMKDPAKFSEMIKQLAPMVERMQSAKNAGVDTQNEDTEGGS